MRLGILEKHEIREALFKNGLIRLDPTNLVSLGTPREYFKNGLVFILILDSVTIKVGDNLVVKKNNDYFEVTIESLQKDDKEIQECSDGEVGIKVSSNLKKNSELYVKNS